MAPAAIMGVDVRTLLDRAKMMHACAACVSVEQNRGVVLGTILGVAADRFGCDKVTLVTSPRIAGLSAGNYMNYIAGDSRAPRRSADED